MELKVRVTEVFPSFMGEVNKYGIGAPCTFIRLAGCNLSCYKSTGGCDTPESMSYKSGRDMKIPELVNEVAKYNNRIICLTGGEPLLQTGPVGVLLQTLVANGFNIVVETNGSVDIAPYICLKNTSFVVDYKLPSTEMNKEMKLHMGLLTNDDFVKFVVKTEEDYCFAKMVIKSEKTNATYAMGVFWGDGEFSEKSLWDRIKEDRLPVVLNMQAHKMITVLDDQDIRKKISDISIPKSL